MYVTESQKGEEKYQKKKPGIFEVGDNTQFIYPKQSINPLKNKHKENHTEAQYNQIAKNQ